MLIGIYETYSVIKKYKKTKNRDNIKEKNKLGGDIK